MYQGFLSKAKSEEEMYEALQQFHFHPVGRYFRGLNEEWAEKLVGEGKLKKRSVKEKRQGYYPDGTPWQVEESINEYCLIITEEMIQRQVKIEHTFGGKNAEEWRRTADGLYTGDLESWPYSEEYELAGYYMWFSKILAKLDREVGKQHADGEKQ